LSTWWQHEENIWKTFGNPNFQKNPISGWELTRVHPLSSVVIGPVVTSNSGKTFLIIMSKEFESSSFHNSDGMGDSLVIYLWRKVVCFVLFCFVVMSSTEQGCFRSCSWCLLKALNKEGVHGLGSTCFTKVLEYWMISSLKIKLNRN
jgi:hypothetical protein